MSEPTRQVLVTEVENGNEPRSRSDRSSLCERELTRHVRLVLDNDSELYKQRRAIVRDHLAARDECPFCGGLGETIDREGDHVDCERCELSGQVGRYPHQLGDRLKDWCEGLVGLHSPNVIRSNGLLATEILSTALAWVDWTELANDYIEEERES